MGMFDYIMIPCPTCGKEVEFQSKGGDCNMDVYTLGNIPPAIAGDIHNEVEICKNCGKKVRIITQVIVTPVGEIEKNKEQIDVDNADIDDWYSD